METVYCVMTKSGKLITILKSETKANEFKNKSRYAKHWKVVKWGVN